MTPLPILALCLSIVPAFAQSNGIDMSMDVSMNLAVGNMLPYAHFTPGDNVWFPGWVPSSAGAMIGTCIGLLFLAMLERWLAACLSLAEQHWAERASVLVVQSSLPTSLGSPPSSSPSDRKSKLHSLTPFVTEFDITRGTLFAAHSFLNILLMLAVMTFQLAFLLAIVVGSGVGETLFGGFLSLSGRIDE